MSARVESARPVVIGREEFLADYWTYKSGEHVTLIAPTQSGKTTLAFQLLARSAGPSLPAVVLVTDGLGAGVVHGPVGSAIG